ncbi:AraC family transcriptional regulator [Aquimarina sp. I32.4]|uniref:AraC family transcriptional regulator n=1 Tax=Aquimarina sp. I32.4 TaxID=2053903 RepID=UPI000CDEF1D6|nr:AraC family transcriptional regulator [Aquimarina sp. I32.4]
MSFYYCMPHNNKRNLLLVFLFYTFITFNITSQEFKENDSLEKYSYVQLENLFYLNEDNPALAEEYVDYYLKKAKKAKDSIKIAEAFYMFSTTKKNENPISIIDSIIKFTKNSNHFEYPAKAYSLKGILLYKLGKHKEALDVYLLAYDHAIKNGNIEQKSEISFKIGILKNDLGDYKEALKSFKSYYNYIQEYYKNDSLHYKKHVKILFAIADGYNRLRKHDSASFILNRAFQLSKGSKNSSYNPYLTAMSGITYYYMKDYQKSRDSIFKSLSGLKKIGDFGNVSTSHLYLGKGYYDQKKSYQALIHFSKVDSIFKGKGLVYPEMREVYEIFIDYYKSKDDREKQLYYLESLVKIDSTLNNDYRYLSKKIEKKYNTSELLIEKQNLITYIKNKREKSTFWIIFLSVFLLIVTSLTYNYYWKQKKLKRKIDQYLNREKEIKNQIPSKKKQGKSINLSDKVVEEIRKNLKNFENNNQFLNKNLTQKDVANLIETNSTYLSKIVNQFEGKNFAVYINDLRIDYAIEEIKNNSKIRKYSIKHIAEEVGFNNAESFSKAFYRKTGLYPSFFIKNITNLKRSN